MVGQSLDVGHPSVDHIQGEKSEDDAAGERHAPTECMAEKRTKGNAQQIGYRMPAHIIATALVPLPSRAIFTATIVAVPK